MSNEQPPIELIEHQICQTSELLMSSTEPLWARLRQLLMEQGVDTKKSALAEWVSDDNDFYFGIVIYGDRVFQFGFGFYNLEPSAGILDEWVDLTETWQGTPHAQTVSIAKGMLGV